MKKNAKAVVVGLCLSLGMLSAGCGAPVAEPEDAETLETREDPIPDCSKPGAGFNAYYSDINLTQLVGYKGCCGFEYYYMGRTSPYWTYSQNDTCVLPL